MVLSVWIGVGGCLWPISSRSLLTGMACLEFKKRAQILASAAEIMTLFMILAVLSTAPLSFELITSLHASFGSTRGVHFSQPPKCTIFHVLAIANFKQNFIFV